MLYIIDKANQTLWTVGPKDSMVAAEAKHGKEEVLNPRMFCRLLAIWDDFASLWRQMYPSLSLYVPPKW